MESDRIGAREHNATLRGMWAMLTDASAAVGFTRHDGALVSGLRDWQASADYWRALRVTLNGGMIAAARDNDAR